MNGDTEQTDIAECIDERGHQWYYFHTWFSMNRKVAISTQPNEPNQTNTERVYVCPRCNQCKVERVYE